MKTVPGAGSDSKGSAFPCLESRDGQRFPAARSAVQGDMGTRREAVGCEPQHLAGRPARPAGRTNSVTIVLDIDFQVHF